MTKNGHRELHDGDIFHARASISSPGKRRSCDRVLNGFRSTLIYEYIVISNPHHQIYKVYLATCLIRDRQYIFS